MKKQWLNSLRIQIGAAILAIFLLMIGTLGYTLYSLHLRQHDYLILNLAGQLRVLSQSMIEQSQHYTEVAPDDEGKYARDLATYWKDLQKQIILYDKIIRSLESRQIAADLVGDHTSVIQCNFDNQLNSQLHQTMGDWMRFQAGLQDKLGPNLAEPRLTWAAEYIQGHGALLAKSSNRLSGAFQHMMEKKLDHIRVFLWASGGLGLLLVVLVMFILQHRLITPLKQTIKGFARVAQGDFGHQVAMQSGNEIGQMTEAFNLLTQRINGIFKLTDRINQGHKLDDMLRFVHDEFQGFVPLNWVGVFYPTPDGGRLTLERHYSGVSNQIKNGASFDATQGVMATLGTASVALTLETKNAPQSLENALLQLSLRSAVYMPILSGKQQAVMVFASTEVAYRPEHVEFLTNIAATISHVLEKTVVMENLVVAAVEGLAKLAESRDPETGDHLVRMALYSALVAEELGKEGVYMTQITPAYVRDVFNFAPMHDIGKVGIADSVLLKPARLDPVERKEMERHPVIGGEVLRKSEAQVQALGHTVFQVGIEIAECHHEKFDGSGYPAGLKGQEIPLSARIIAAADVFDALTSKRPYKEAWTVESALEAMQKDAGKHFDPEVINAMMRALPRMMEIYDRLKHV
ncbi:MAG: HD domain-containing phosphohydrolase [Methylophilaceae bacterium]